MLMLGQEMKREDAAVNLQLNAMAAQASGKDIEKQINSLISDE